MCWPGNDGSGDDANDDDDDDDDDDVDYDAIYNNEKMIRHKKVRQIMLVTSQIMKIVKMMAMSMVDFQISDHDPKLTIFQHVGIKDQIQVEKGCV